MRIADRTKEQLSGELGALRLRIAELEKAETERKQVEKALQAEKNKLQSVIGAMEDGLTIQDRDYNIIYQNELLRRIFGDHLGEKCHRVYESKEKLCDGCPLEKAFKDGKSHTSERRVILPSGEVTFWENTANPIRDASGKIISCLEVARNITERKRAEEALRESEERYRFIFDKVPASIILLDKDGKMVDVNPHHIIKVGKGKTSRKGYLGQNIVTHPTMANARLSETYARLLKGEPFDLEGVHFPTTAAGIDCYRNVKGVPLFKDGKVIGAITMFEDITERKQAEEALRQSREQLRKMFESATDGIVVIDLNGIITEVNQRFAEMHGFNSKAELLGKSALELIAPGDHGRVITNMRKTLKQGAIRGVEYTLLKADGSEFPGELSTNTLKDASDNPVGHITIARDITERKRAEEVTRSKLEFERIISAISSRFVSPSDMDDAINKSLADIGRFSGTSRAYLFLFREDRTTADNTHEWCAEGVSRQIDNNQNVPTETLGWMAHIQQGELVQIEDVSQMPPEASAEKALLESQKIKSLLLSPVYDSSGKTFGFLGFDDVVAPRKWSDAASTILRMSSEIIGNAIERKQAEEAFKLQTAYFQQLFDDSPDAIAWLDDTDRFTNVNKGFEKLFGYSIEEIKGRFINDTLVPEDHMEEASALSRAALSNEVRRRDTVRKRKNGSLVDVDTLGYPIRFGNKVVGLYVIYIDITERKRAEEERIEMEQKAHLASRLASVGEMASGIAHEINNPMTAVIGFSQLLMESKLPDDVKEDISIIHKEAQRAASVARNLLTFARRHAPAKQLTNINSIIEGVLKLRAYEQSVSNIRVNNHFAPDLPEVMVDYSQMQQVFINIILNAEAAMLESSNSGILTITTRRVNDSVRASFTDSGPGIAKENLNRIFDPFFTTKEVGKGTGLGLSVCHGIIAEHGGRIYARSKSGRGATFVVELPTNAHPSSGRS